MKYSYSVSYLDVASGESNAKAKNNIDTYAQAEDVIKFYQAEEAAGRVKLQRFQVNGYLQTAQQNAQ